MPRSPRLLFSLYRPYIVLPILLVVAALLRLHGIDWDSGFGFHPDERSIYMRAQCMYDVLFQQPGYQDCLLAHPQMQPGFPGISTMLDSARSPLNPHWFPLGSVLIYILVIVQFLTDPFVDLGGLEIRYFARVLSTLADLGTICFVFLLGRRMFHFKVGLLAALLVTFSVIHIQNSHFYRPETFSVCLILMSFWAMLRVMEYGRMRDSAVLGILVGLALTPKISAVSMLIVLGIPYFLQAIKCSYTTSQGFRVSFAYRPLAYALLAACLAAAVFIIVTPYALLDAGAFVRDLKAQSHMANHAGIWPFTYQYVDTPDFIYQIYQSTVWGLGIPLGVLCWLSVLFTIGFALTSRSHRRFDLMLLACVIPTFIFLESFEVKFLRYVFPLIPFLILMAARFLWWVTEVISRPLIIRLPSLFASLCESNGNKVVIRNKLFSRVTFVLIGLLIIFTGFYALAFQSIYANPHPAVTASEWIQENIQSGSILISDNHWDEYIPVLDRYRIWQFPAYDPDNQAKIDKLSRRLAEADYLVFYSNRPYGSVARLPTEFPLSSRYYIKLFEGELGYRLDKSFSSYPNLLNVHFRDDPFDRAQVQRPEPSISRDKAIILDLGYADDNVIGYDHPQVLIFRNVDKKEESELRQILVPKEASGNVLMPQVRYRGIQGRDQKLMLSESEWMVQKRGGTWSLMFDRNSWKNRLPVLAWLLVIELGWLIAIPITLFIFRGLPDRGLGLAKIFSFLIIGYLVWLSVSLELFQFTTSAIFYVSFLVLSVSCIVLRVARKEIIGFIREKWRLVLVMDIIFLFAFFIFLWIRASNPDLWHPFRGGEKPMELAYLNAVIRSSLFPPFDPWFSGGYLNYYYWGYFLVSLPVKVSGVLPTTAFNLAIPTFFALSITGAFSLGYNITSNIRGLGSIWIFNNRRTEAYSSNPNNGSDLGGLWAESNNCNAISWASRLTKKIRIPVPVMIGIFAAIVIVVAGNLDGIIQIFEIPKGDIKGALTSGQAFDFWRSSRLIPPLNNVDNAILLFWLPDSTGNTSEISHHITEFPFFSFLFSDLHPHLMNIPFAMLVLGLGINLLAGFERSGLAWRIAASGLLALGLGSLWVINSWDYPTYVLLVVAFLALTAYGMSVSPYKQLMLFAGLVMSIIGTSWVLFSPFHGSYETFNTGIEISKWKTPLDSYLVIHGLFLFIAASFLILKVYAQVYGILRKVCHKKSLLLQELICLMLLLVGLVIVFYLNVAGYWTAAFLIILFTLTGVSVVIELTDRPFKNKIQIIPLVLLGMGLAISIGVDFVHLSGDIGRMNTVFKLYLQVWLLFGLSTSYMAFFVIHRLWHSWGRGRSYKNVTVIWLSTAMFLLGSSLIYPVLGTIDRINDRFGESSDFLDGAGYMVKAEHQEKGVKLDLIWDLEAINWLQDNVTGSPVILEAQDAQYRWNGRVSAYTGLPTLLGWPWHQIQQRNDYQSLILQRSDDIKSIYNSQDIKMTLTLLHSYKVSYIYVGELEKTYYSDVGLSKFDRMVSGGMIEQVFQNNGVTIYRTFIK